MSEWINHVEVIILLVQHGSYVLKSFFFSFKAHVFENLIEEREKERERGTERERERDRERCLLSVGFLMPAVARDELD